MNQVPAFGESMSRYEWSVLSLYQEVDSEAKTTMMHSWNPNTV